MGDIVKKIWFFWKRIKMKLLNFLGGKTVEKDNKNFVSRFFKSLAQKEAIRVFCMGTAMRDKLGKDKVDKALLAASKILGYETPKACHDHIVSMTMGPGLEEWGLIMQAKPNASDEKIGKIKDKLKAFEQTIQFNAQMCMKKSKAVKAIVKSVFFYSAWRLGSWLQAMGILVGMNGVYRAAADLSSGNVDKVIDRAKDFSAWTGSLVHEPEEQVASAA